MCGTNYSHRAGIRQRPWFTCQTGEICQNQLFFLGSYYPSVLADDTVSVVWFHHSLKDISDWGDQRCVSVDQTDPVCDWEDWQSTKELMPGVVLVMWKLSKWGGFGCIWMEKSGIHVKRWGLECWHGGVCGQNSQVVLYVSDIIV